MPNISCTVKTNAMINILVSDSIFTVLKKVLAIYPIINSHWFRRVLDQHDVCFCQANVILEFISFFRYYVI